MASEKENRKTEQKKVVKKGTTRHCCYGTCRSDSRYSDRDYMNNVTWLTFPKPKTNFEKCQRWTRACGRENFSTENVKKWTYICSKHFVGENGPTNDHPDPIPASFTPQQSDKFSRKRKAPTPRSAPVSKKQLFEVSEALLSLQDVCPPENHGSSIISASPMLEHSMADITNTPNGTSSYRVSDTFSKGTQTTFACSDLVAGKINQIINKNNASLNSKVSSGKPVPKFGYKKLSKNGKLFKFYSGITVTQFNHLFNCFGDTVNNLIYWKGNKTRKSVSTKIRKSITRKITPKNQLLLTLIKLRQAFPNKDLAYRFDTSISSVSEIVNTWIQFLFKQTACIRQRMFPSRELIREHLPASFKSFKNVRVIIDCFEIFVQSSRDFAEQGNLYSSYKHHSTLKCLAGIAPTGGITFLSDVYEGSISDKDIFIKSGLLELLNPGDLVIADRGFLIKEVLQSRKVELNIPPFLCGREKLTPQEEILTKRIARVRIHVERVIERMKKFKIIGSRLALNLKPVASQIVHIIGLLVNYQEPLVK